MADIKYYDVILKPIITEKSMNVMIKEAVEKMFSGAKVAKVNTMNVNGKNRRRGNDVGKTAKVKKAIVQLTEDSADIEIFQGL